MLKETCINTVKSQCDKLNNLNYIIQIYWFWSIDQRDEILYLCIQIIFDMKIQNFKLVFNTSNNLSLSFGLYNKL